MKRVISIIILFSTALMGSLAYGSTFAVVQDGSGDFISIQAAIDYAAEGDSIFVAPGIYNDSIDFIGKDLLVASHFLLSGNADDIANTVISPSAGGSCVTFDNGETRNARLVGFTLRDGWGTYFIWDVAGGGVYIYGASPTLEHLVITECWSWGAGIFVFSGSPRLSSLEIHHNISEGVIPYGGGIYLEYGSGTEITNCHIHDNYGRGGGGAIAIESSTGVVLRDNEIRRNKAGAGGGIRLSFQSNALLKDNLIVGNTAKRGGGLYLYQQSDIQLKGDCITGNHARQGGGLYIADDCSVNFNTMTKCSIYGNLGLWARDIQVMSPDIIPVVVDTFSVSQPTIVHLSPPDHVNLSFEHVLWSQVDGDLYVATDGDDTASGISPDQALRTIHHAVARLAPGAETVRTIYLAPGTYSPSQTGEVFPQLLLSQTQLVGAGQENTILDAEGSFSGVVCGVPDAESVDVSVRHLTITGTVNWGAVRCYYTDVKLEFLTLANNSSDSIYSSWNGSDYVCGGVSVWGGQVALEYCKIQDNISERGWSAGAVACTDAALLRMNRVLVTGNNAGTGGGPVAISNQSRVAFYNSTITDNEGDEDSAGFTFRGSGNHLSLVNSIIWNNVGPEVSFRSTDYSDTLLVAHCDLEGGEAGLDHQVAGVVHWQEENFDSDPQFIDSASGGNYELNPGSPCIDAGTVMFNNPNPFFQIDLIPEDFNGSAPDVGAMEFFPVVATMDNAVPGLAVLGEPYPNPFNPRTTLAYELTGPATVSLCIYDLGGSLVRILIEGRAHESGTFSAHWDGKNTQGESMSSGMYFFRLGTEKYSRTVRATLIR